MKDSEYDAVIEDGISFQTGTFLECELEICRKLDDNGDEYNSSYKIHKVFNKRLGDSVIEMPSGKKRRERKNWEDSQRSLFDDME